jgi:hypothetical protein
MIVTSQPPIVYSNYPPNQQSYSSSQYGYNPSYYSYQNYNKNFNQIPQNPTVVGNYYAAPEPPRHHEYPSMGILIDFS